jgi:hypothetical protein
MESQRHLRDLVADVLDACTDDHCMIAWIEADIEQQAAGSSADDVKRLTIAIVRTLLDAGLVEAGIPEGSEFHADGACPMDIARRIADHWEAPIDDLADVRYSLWLSATPSGEAVAHGEGDGAVLDRVAEEVGIALAAETDSPGSGSR